MDTDILIIHIKTVDFYEEITDDIENYGEDDKNHF